MKLPSKAIVLTTCDILSKIKKLVNNKCACVRESIKCIWLRWNHPEGGEWERGNGEGGGGGGGVEERFQKRRQQQEAQSLLECIVEKGFC